MNTIDLTLAWLASRSGAIASAGYVALSEIVGGHGADSIACDLDGGRYWVRITTWRRGNCDVEILSVATEESLRFLQFDQVTVEHLDSLLATLRDEFPGALPA